MNQLCLRKYAIKIIYWNDIYYYLTDDGCLFKKSLISKNIIKTGIVNMKISTGTIYLTDKDGFIFELTNLSILDLPNELIQMICDNLDFDSKINLKYVSKRFSNLNINRFYKNHKFVPCNLFDMKHDISNILALTNIHKTAVSNDLQNIQLILSLDGCVCMQFID